MVRFSLSAVVRGIRNNWLWLGGRRIASARRHWLVGSEEHRVGESCDTGRGREGRRVCPCPVSSAHFSRHAHRSYWRFLRFIHRGIINGFTLCSVYFIPLPVIRAFIAVSLDDASSVAKYRHAEHIVKDFHLITIM